MAGFNPIKLIRDLIDRLRYGPEPEEDPEVWREHYFWRQASNADCGPACVMMFCRYYSAERRIEEVRELSSYDPENGTSVLGVSKALEHIGFRTLAAKLEFKDLVEEAPYPCMLHWNNNYFVILIDVDYTEAMIAHPKLGVFKMDRERFLASWNGVALFVEPLE